MEAVALLIGLAVTAALAVGVGRDFWARRRERIYLEKMQSDLERRDDGAEIPRHTRTTRLLRAAGIRLHPAIFAAALALLGLFAALAVRRFLLDSLPAAVLSGAFTIHLLRVAIAARGRQRARDFENRLVDAVALMIGALKAGENLTGAFASAAEAALGAVRREFREVAYRLGLGMNVRRALQRIDLGYDCEGVRLFTRTVIAKWQAGGDLAPVLENVNQVLRERIRIRWRLHSQLAGARLAQVFTALMPYVLIPFFLWQRPDWIARLRDHPLGPKLLFGAIIVQILGLLWMRRIMKVEL